MRNSPLVYSLAIVGGVIGCSAAPHVELGEEPMTTRTPGSIGSVTAELVVATPQALPACNSMLGGTTAFVQSNTGLYQCLRGSWTRETCTVDRAGEVAFVTGETFLLACSARTWTRVNLPAGTPGTPGAAGTNALVATSAEAAGANCANGGLRVASGQDANRNGILDGAEATSTSFVCNGAGGAAAATIRTAVTTAPSCAAGGQSIQVYQDLNSSGVPDVGEELGSPIVVCNGDPTTANGAQPVVSAHRGANVVGVVAGEEFSTTGSVTALRATITVPRAGTVAAVGTSRAYCDSTGTFPDYGSCYSADAGYTSAWLTILESTALQAGNSGAAVLQSLSVDVDNAITATDVFEVSAGTYTFNLVGMASDVDHTEIDDGAVASRVYFGASDLTLIFVPN